MKHLVSCLLAFSLATPAAAEPPIRPIELPERRLNPNGFIQPVRQLKSPKLTPRNVRMAVYNVKQLPLLLCDDGNMYDVDGRPLTDLERVQRIADRILASDLEVVVLNEVFDADAQQRFARLLDPVFPYHVDRIDSLLDPVDSGLMVFSRHPFVQMELGQRDTPEIVKWFNGDGVPRRRSGGFVGFQPFRCDASYAEYAFEQADCLANKGVGLVKIRLPLGEDVLVAFSHFVASYEDDEVEVLCAKRRDRGRALAQAADLLTAGAGADGDEAYAVFLGDLNIDGNPHEPIERKCEDGQWTDMFDPVDPFVPFAACGDLSDARCQAEGRLLVDAWAFDTSPEDLGRTASFPFTMDLSDVNQFSEGERLDYVLYRGGSASHGPVRRPAMVPQHLTIPYGLSGETGSLSDHLPVAVDMLLPRNVGALRHATPRLARDIDVPPAGRIVTPMRITEPGQVQWSLLDGASGTYELFTEGGLPTHFEIYAPHDLSRPLKPWRAAGHKTATYALPAPPYYVKTYARTKDATTHDRYAMGDYRIIARQHDCQTPRDACVLMTGELPGTLAEWPRDQLGREDALYFEFLADDADEPIAPTHTFAIATTGAPLPRFNFEVLTHPTAERVPDLDEVGASLTPIRQSVSLRGMRGRAEVPTWKSYLLKVQRTDPDFNGPTRVSHTSDLTYFVPRSISVHQEDDASAHDELWITLTPGTRLGEQVTARNVHRHMAHFTELPLIDELEDGGTPWPAHGLGQKRFISGLSAMIVEDDDEDDEFERGDLLFGAPNDTNPQRNANGQVIMPLSPGDSALETRWIWSSRTRNVASDPDDTDYMYSLRFRLSHMPPCLIWSDVPGC